MGFAIAYWPLLGLDANAGGSTNGHEAIFFEPTGSSPPLIFALTAYMLAARRNRLRACFARSGASAFASAFLGAGCLLSAWAHYSDRIELNVAALSLVLIGLAAAFAGREGARVIAYPAAFLLLALPIPRVLVNWIVYPLQLATANVTTAIVSFMGVPAAQWGDILVAQGRVFQVIESCSGLRSATTMIMSAMVYSDIFARGRRHTLVLLAAAPFIGLVVNELRVLSMVANPYSANETIHTIQGLAMIVLGVLALAGLDRLLVRRGPRDRPGNPAARNPEGRPAGLSGPLIASGLALGLAAFSFVVVPWVLPPDEGPQASSFPGVVGAWTTTARRQLDRDFLGSVAFDQCALREFKKGEKQVELFLCSDRRANGGDRMLSRKMWVPGPGWENTDLGPLTLPAWPYRADLAVARSSREARLLMHWRVGAQSIAAEILRGALGLDRGPYRREDRALAIRISTNLDDGGVDQAGTRIAEFLTDARPALMRQANLAEAEPTEILDARAP